MSEASLSTPQARPSAPAASPGAAWGWSRRRSAKRRTAASSRGTRGRGRGRGGSCRWRSRADACFDRLVQQLAHAGEELHRVLAREEMLAVARDELGIALGRQLRAPRCACASCSPRPMTWLARSRVGHRAGRARGSPRGCTRRSSPAESMIVPSQSNTSSRYFTAASSPGTPASRPAAATRASPARRSAGGGTRASPRAGAAAACSRRLSAKSPYLSSPTTGCPACARCTRIWCVRPVMQPHLEQAELAGLLQHS